MAKQRSPQFKPRKIGVRRCFRIHWLLYGGGLGQDAPLPDFRNTQYGTEPPHLLLHGNIAEMGQQQRFVTSEIRPVTLQKPTFVLTSLNWLARIHPMTACV